jgi:hypothetical protein
MTVDGVVFAASDTTPLLVPPEQGWFADLVAVVIDLGGRSVRANRSDALRRAVTVLRRIRIVEADRIETGVGGDTIEAAHLAVPDDRYPTVLLRRSADPLRLFERAAPAISDLLGQPTLEDSLRLALMLLAQDGYGLDRPPDPAVIAKVLDKPVELVE